MFTHEETTRVISLLKGTSRLAASLMYGSGLRVSEVARLRIQDILFDRSCIVVREAKGLKSRQTLLPNSLHDQLKRQVDFVLIQHQRDISDGYGSVYLPYALARKYPNASREPGWQYLFPAREVSADPRSGELRRHHVTERTFQRAVGKAIRAAGILLSACTNGVCRVRSMSDDSYKGRCQSTARLRGRINHLLSRFRGSMHLRIDCK